MDYMSVASTGIRRAKYLRLAHRCLPLGRRYTLLAGNWERKGEILNVEWGRYQFFFPGAWTRASAELIYKRPEDINPEFFQVFAPALAALQEGTILEIGAAVGVYLLNYANCTALPVLAYEPTPTAFAILNLNVVRNRLEKIELRNRACGNESKEIRMHAGLNSFVEHDKPGGGAEKPDQELSVDDMLWEVRTDDKLPVHVKMVRLDDDVAPDRRIAAMKIDCEGMEYDILLGARELIRRWCPLIFIELHPLWIQNYGASLEQVCDLLEPDYELQFWDFSRLERAGNPFQRLFSRYSNRGELLPTRAAMMERAATEPRPAQIFMLASPKGRRS